ncbi:electron transport complex protein RnfC [Actinobacillus porcinus]|uniref:Ion-translocating oxidoreductase complex subunit C n=1 Tax=Actinobacillus porcinus TaxID=51048 RepID=A0ABY6TJ68_9PAST|nr:electron transport complex subunit RsxC [Actinobacillus porcinus]VFY92948.1 electron transport complex protein RnfC [Actinobacillus porcinus]VTU07596.1 electron transport complex protein RnfC [Actinobacillus porcinus]
MTDVISRYNSGKLWDFAGGIHPPEMKSQSNQTPITHAPLATHFYVPVKQHAGSAGNILVNVGDTVLKGQALTQGDGLRALPVHAPTSGKIVAIAPHIAAHPSGLSELSIHIEADGLDQWREQCPVDDFLQLSPEQLIQKIYGAGIAGLGGAVFPTAAKVDAAQNKVKLLIINGAECEPYITCDDRLMRDYAEEIIEGCRILRYILRPEKMVIAIEDNKPEAIQALKHALHGANDIDIRVIPTKYPSGAAKQLIQILTGMEVPSGQRSSSIGVLMQNVGTVFAIKRAVINDEPLIERVVTLTGDKIPNKGNQWVRFGTPIHFLLEKAGYQADTRFPVFVGGPMMGLMVPDLTAPVTKTANCLLAPDHFEYDPLATEQSCIRCSACSDACPVHLMPQQMYWYSRAEDHDNAKKQNIMDCIECGLCAYVCPSHIPLIQYFRQEKAKIWDIADKAKKSEEAKVRFEARQARLEQEAKARQARSQRAAAARREEVAANQGEDPVKAALERLKAKKAGEATTINADAKIKTIIGKNGETLPDNADLMAQRKARRLARQQELDQSKVTNGACGSIPETEKNAENSTALDPKKAAVAAALARAKAKKAAQQQNTETTPQSTQSAVENTTVSTSETPAETDPKKAAVAAAIARAKAKKAQQQNTESAPQSPQSVVENTTVSTSETPAETDPKKAAVAAAIARAKAKKAAQQQNTETTPQSSQSAVENTTVSEPETAQETDPKKAAVAAAIARAKAKKAAQQTKTY